MSEQPKEEAISTLENLEDQKYADLKSSMDEEDRIMKEIDGLLSASPDREEAEKAILEKYASLMDEAMKKSRQALGEWLSIIEKER